MESTVLGLGVGVPLLCGLLIARFSGRQTKRDPTEKWNKRFDDPYVRTLSFFATIFLLFPSFRLFQSVSGMLLPTSVRFSRSYETVELLTTSFIAIACSCFLTLLALFWGDQGERR